MKLNNGKGNSASIDKTQIIKYTKRAFIIACIIGLIGVLALVGLISAIGFGAFGKLPTVEELKSIKNPVASEVYSADGVLLGRYYLENRTNVKYNEISPTVIKALVATEDARFFEHKGIDTKSVLRVLIKTILMGNRSSGGGSTINQQLIKNLYKRQDYGMLSMPVNKIKEIIVGKRLEKVYSKEDILTQYLNTVPFGERVFGIEEASQRYYSKSCKDLSLDEAATLVGMLKATTWYSPRLYPERAKGRRNTVLNQMVKYGYLEESVATAAKSLPVLLNYDFKSQSDGLAPHFRAMLKSELKDWCENNPKSDGSNYNLFTDGLKIYTTIDSRMQNYAEASVQKHMKKLQAQFDQHWGSQQPWGADKSLTKNGMRATRRYKTMKKAGKSDMEIEAEFYKATPMTIYSPVHGEKDVTITPMDSIIHYLRLLNTGFMVMEHKTGHIKSWVGSIDHEHYPYDHTRSTRQVGSTFKPLVYATALESGADPCRFYPNHLATYIDEYDKRWTPRNSDEFYDGEYSMRGGLAKSVNTISVQVIYEAGVNSVIETAQKMGIQSEIPAFPSIALGTPDISLQEMLKPYAAFGNGGYNIEPKYLTAIKSPDNKTLVEYDMNAEYSEAISQSTAELMTEMLQAVVDSGTGRRLRYHYNLQQDFAGKTGTTQNQSDGWFIGYTPDLVAGAWTGGQSRMIHFRDISLGQGANMALPIFGEFFKNLYADNNFQELAQAKFNEPTVDNYFALDCDLWRLEAPPEPIDSSTTILSQVEEILKNGLGKNKRQHNNSGNNNGNILKNPKSKDNQGGVLKPKKEKDKKKKGSWWDRLLGKKKN